MDGVNTWMAQFQTARFFSNDFCSRSLMIWCTHLSARRQIDAVGKPRNQKDQHGQGLNDREKYQDLLVIINMSGSSDQCD